MYTCGLTDYDSAHVGNFRAFLTYDVLKRVLTFLGYNANHICNLTNVDDKIIKRCDREDVGLLELTRKSEGKFFDDLEALNIVKARAYPPAMDHIQEMAQLIIDLEKNGLTYQRSE
jgi:cysteinyl-tRNA synthetase